MNKSERNENIGLFANLKENNINNVYDNDNNNYLSFRGNQTDNIKKYNKRTTIIEEPSILSNQSDTPPEDNKIIREIKTIVPFTDHFPKHINQSPSIIKKREITCFKSSTGKRRKENSVYSKRSHKSHKKSFYKSKSEKMFKSGISNTNFSLTSELRSDYTHASSFEFFINDNEKNLEFKLKDNTITTTKYNFITFIPKGLLYQFSRLSNVYFLFTAIIQSIPIISPLNSLTAIVPLIFVLGVSMIRELIEDFGRNKYDKLNNDEEVIVLRNGEFIKSKSRTLKSGEIVLIYENMPIPADLVLIDSGTREGECYIETSSLDGEKTLKLKIANKKIYGLFSKKLENINTNKKIEKIKNLIDFTISGFIQVIPANANLNQIDGKLNFFVQDDNSLKEDNFPITMKEFLLKGSILKNTNWIIGIIIYTGMNNKIILNSKKPRMKVSTIETKMNHCLIGIFILLIICCIICCVLNYYQYNSNKHFYDNFIQLEKDLSTYCIINFFTYFLLLNTLIPISLIVTIEIIKMIQGVFIQLDAKLYCKSRHYFCKAKTVSINEELGNINFIFSDKTGTLTMNQLQLRYCIIKDEIFESIDLIRKNNENIYRKSRFSINISDVPRISNYFKEGFFYEFLRKKQEKLQECEDNGKTIIDNNIIIHKAELEKEIFYINEFFIALAITNECMVSDNNGDIKYIGTSPDDLELVKTAYKQGFKLIHTSFDKKTVIIGEKEINFEILNVLDFSSERKRMSIIFREPGGKIKIYTKGADCEIIKRLTEKSKNSKIFQKINKDVECFSNLGYRTLMIASKEIKEKDFIQWRKKLHLEELNIQKKSKEIEKYYDSIEKNFEILGATIIEDKLQDRVPQTIKEIKSAGIKFWVLTGDKMNTAENIGFSCNLISRHQKIFKLSCLDNDEERVKYDSNREILKFFRDFQKYLKYLGKKYNYYKLNSIISKSSEIKRDKNSNVDDASSNISSSYAINYELFEHLKKKQYIEPYSIIIEAPILIGLFRDEEQTEKFLSICYYADSVLCCRVSPFQKSQIVQKMKFFFPNAVTLAIGDGGNDVSMIMEANIGIGIIGEEGMSAANASDFSIGEFKLLQRLLFFHGRTNLNRISKLILYFFYKNIIFTISQFFFSPISLSSGQTIIDDWYITCYNLIFTAIPLCVTSLTDFDVREEDGKEVIDNFPLLYKESRDDKKIFTGYSFLIVIIKGIFISLIMFLFCIHNINLNNKGNISDLWYLSLLYYLSILIVVTNHLFFITKYIVIILPIVVLITTFLLLAAFLLIVHYGLIFEFKSKASIFPSLGNLSFYLYLLFLIGINIIIDYIIKIHSFYFENSLASELERMRVKVNERKKLLKNNKIIKNEKTNEIKRSISNSIENSKLFFINKINVKNANNDNDKISFFNKKHLSKFSDFKISSIKKIPNSINVIKKNFSIVNGSEDEKE